MTAAVLWTKSTSAAVKNYS